MKNLAAHIEPTPENIRIHVTEPRYSGSQPHIIMSYFDLALMDGDRETPETNVGITMCVDISSFLEKKHVPGEVYEKGEYEAAHQKAMARMVAYCEVIKQKLGES